MVKQDKGIEVFKHDKFVYGVSPAYTLHFLIYLKTVKESFNPIFDLLNNIYFLKTGN